MFFRCGTQAIQAWKIIPNFCFEVQDRSTYFNQRNDLFVAVSMALSCRFMLKIKRLAFGRQASGSWAMRTFCAPSLIMPWSTQMLSIKTLVVFSRQEWKGGDNHQNNSQKQLGCKKRNFGAWALRVKQVSRFTYSLKQSWCVFLVLDPPKSTNFK